MELSALFTCRQADKERMEELCCMAALGELSVAEKRELDAHLSECGECRKLRKDFEDMAYFDLSVVAADRRAKTSSGAPALDGADQLLARVLEKAKHEKIAHTLPTIEPVRSHTSWMQSWAQRWMWGLAAASVACVALGTLIIENPARRHDAEPVAVAARPDPGQQDAAAAQWKQKLDAALDENQTLKEQLDQLRNDQSQKLSALAQIKSDYNGAQANQATLQQRLDDLTAHIKQAQAELDGTRVTLAQEQQQNLSLKAQLDDATSIAQESQKREAVQEREPVATPVSAEKPVTKNTISEADARELFGARDLHIVDVYDVDRSGKTKRTYGRVFYVDRRLLLFYAFDLGNKKRGRALGSFQAWGYRDPHSSKPESLGLFHVDDASLNRWVLRVSNPEILTRIDTVFVTLEPPQGSPYPRGQKLLLASLAGPANHP